VKEIPDGDGRRRGVFQGVAPAGNEKPETLGYSAWERSEKTPCKEGSIQ